MKKILALALVVITAVCVAVAQTPAPVQVVQPAAPVTKLTVDALVFESASYMSHPADEIISTTWFDVGNVAGESFYVQATLKNSNLVTVTTSSAKVEWVDLTPSIPFLVTTECYFAEMDTVGNDTVFKFYFTGSSGVYNTVPNGKNVYGNVSVNGVDYSVNFTIARD